MNKLDWVGIISAVIVLSTWGVWFKRIFEVRVPKFRAHYIALSIIAMALSVYAVVGGAGWIGRVPAGVAFLMAALFCIARMQSWQGDNKPSVAVGDQIINFTALDGQGNTFDTASMAGKPYLLKFFRGFW